MSSINPLMHKMLLTEAKKLLKKADLEAIEKGTKEGGMMLTEEDIFDWIQVFEADRIMLDGCNHNTVKR